MNAGGDRRGTLVIATGGTGGHIYPALAVAEELKRRGYHIIFIGQQGGMEARLIPEAGFGYYGVRAGKWHRSRPDPRQGWQALLGLRNAVRHLKEQQPLAVVGFGGFASFPALAAAAWLRVPIMLHEQNSYPGLVTRLFAGRARLLGLVKLEAQPYLKRAPNVVQAGYPVREVRLPKAEARHRLGLPAEGIVTLVMGGSQGSVFLNEQVPLAFENLPDSSRTALSVLHSSGPRWLETLRRRLYRDVSPAPSTIQDESRRGIIYEPARAPHLTPHSSPLTMFHERYHAVPYVEATLAWSAADLAITRAGMGTLAEAAYHGIPLIMVPLPSAADNHQVHNARAVAAAGAGRMVLEPDIDQLATVWQEMLEPTILRSTAQAAAQLSPAGAAKGFADHIEATLTNLHVIKVPARYGVRSQEPT